MTLLHLSARKFSWQLSEPRKALLESQAPSRFRRLRLVQEDYGGHQRDNISVVRLGNCVFQRLLSVGLTQSNIRKDCNRLDRSSQVVVPLSVHDSW